MNRWLKSIVTYFHSFWPLMLLPLSLFVLRLTEKNCYFFFYLLMIGRLKLNRQARNKNEKIKVYWCNCFWKWFLLKFLVCKFCHEIVVVQTTTKFQSVAASCGVYINQNGNLSYILGGSRARGHRLLKTGHTNTKLKFI